MKGFNLWFKETRPHFLILTPLAFSVGIAEAYREGSLDPLRALLGLGGVLLAHVSVNVINDYFDYMSGLDLRVRRTPFSGGSGILPKGLLEPRRVLIFSLICLLLGFSIGVYFTLTVGLVILPIITLAALTIYFYTTHLSHWYLGELFTGFNFGPLISLGGYLIQTGRLGFSPLISGAVPGILIGTLLFLNEFPDLEADRAVGRRNLVILLGLRRASKVYVVLIASVYLWVILHIIIGRMPFTMLIILTTLPLALKASMGVLRYHERLELLIPYMGVNVFLVLLTTLATSIGLILDVIL
ncbi:MAG: prenyltransferase [Candidatus Bathyarchaeia archaeon]|nr:prenyltransferase [Candidatus Bathyarchaeota archaeon]